MTPALRRFAGFAAVLLISSATATSGAAEGASDPAFTLTATAKDFGRYFPSLLANGYVSTLTGPRGTEAQLSYMVALMDYGPDDIARPAAIPGWTEIDYNAGPTAAGDFWLNATALEAHSFEDYRQTLDLRGAALTTAYSWTDRGGKRTRIETTTFVSQASPHLAATRITLTPDFDGVVTLRFSQTLWAPHQPRLPLARLTGQEMQEAVAANNLTLEAAAPATPDRAAIWYHGDTHVLGADGDTGSRTLWLDGRAEGGMKMAQAVAIGLPDGVVPMRSRLVRSATRLSLDLDVAVQKGRRYSFTKYVAFSREGWGGDARADRDLVEAARHQGFARLQTEHEEAWARLWRSDIAIDGDPQAQQAVHADLYYLLSSSTADTAWPMGACALTTGYTGHAFWDSDTWIMPALLLLHPERARSLVNFRARTLPAAQARARERGFKGAMYPWEADPETGTEQTPHFAGVLGEREIHVNADVALAQWQYWLASGDRAWLRSSGWPVIRNVADFWVSRATWNPKTRSYDILHVTSVDEDYNDVPNDTFTNLSARRALEIAGKAARLVDERADPHWAEVASGLAMPFSAAEGRHLDFDASVSHAGASWAGSALPILSIPSLDPPMTQQVRYNDYAFARHEVDVSTRDPNSMGLAPLAIAAATLGETRDVDRWFGEFNGGVLKPPFNVRTETAGNNTGYFITASAGYLETLIYGFTGLRLQDRGLEPAYPPLLPKGWTGMTLKGLTVRGQRFDVKLTRKASGETVIARTPAAAP